jgi:hypothetical protein
LPTDILGLPIGQHISIGAHLEQPDGSTKEIVRSYTPVSGDHQPGYVDLLIKSYPTGNISRHLASLNVGQTIRVRGPKGAFVYTPNMVRHFGMIAGGTGITPMLQVVRAIIRGRKDGDRTEVDLIFANVTPSDILLKEDLDALAKEDKGFRVHYTLDKPDDGWAGEKGFVTAEMITVSSCVTEPGRECRLTMRIEISSQARRRRQDPALWPPAHDQRSQEGNREPRVQEGTPGQQARGPGICVLNARNIRITKSGRPCARFARLWTVLPL